MLKRLLLTAEGESGAAGGGTDAGTAGAGSAAGGEAGDRGTAGAAGANGAAWYTPAETLKRSHPEVWESFENGVKSGAIKDLSSLIVKGISAEKKLGSAITLPGKDAKLEDVDKWSKEVGEKIRAHGFAVVKAQDAPPGSADKYEIKLDAIPEGLRSESTIQAVRDWAHKYGLSNAAVGELMAIESKRYEEQVKPVLELDQQNSQKEFDAWAHSIGKEPKEMEAYGGAWLSKNISEKEMQLLERSGLTNHPVLLRLVAQAGLDTGEDISVRGGGGENLADREYDDVVRMTSDPTHPDYKLWTSGNPQDPRRIALKAKYDAAFKKKWGTGGQEV